LELAEVRGGFVAAGIAPVLADELLAAYVEAKRRFHLGDHRPQGVEGGRFSEAVFRVLQDLCKLPVTPLGKTLPKVDQLMAVYENSTSAPASVRTHIPRTLKLIYDIRNKRDVAHLQDGIDPNLQDATLVIGCMDWVVAELVRINHGVSADRAQHIITELVQKEVPAVQEIDGHPTILADIAPRDQALLMLYRSGAAGLTLDALAGQLRSPRKADLKKRLMRLDQEKLALHHPVSGRFHITLRGIRYVESARLAQPV
jgi:hypothetical protein